MVTGNLRLTAFIVLAALGLAPLLAAPAFAADPVGTWLTGDKKGKVRIVNCGGAICGTLVWMQEPVDPQTNKPKLDARNADASKQSRPLIGIPIVLSMIFVPCAGGISHNEAESTSFDECAAGAQVLLNAVLEFDRKLG